MTRSVEVLCYWYVKDQLVDDLIEALGLDLETGVHSVLMRSLSEERALDLGTSSLWSGLICQLRRSARVQR